MDNEKGGNGGDGAGGTDAEKTASSQNDDGVLKKCLEENKGDSSKCKSKIEAFQSASSQPIRKPLQPLRLKSGLLTDV